MVQTGIIKIHAAFLGYGMFAQQKFKADEERTKLAKAKESLISGCIVSIRDYSGSLVMKSHNFPMSPLLVDKEYKHVMERLHPLEHSAFLRAHDGEAGALPPSKLNEIWFGTQLQFMITKYAEISCGTPIMRINQNCIDGYISQSASPAALLFCNRFVLFIV